MHLNHDTDQASTITANSNTWYHVFEHHFALLSTIGPILNSNSTATSASDPTNSLNSTQLALLRSQISTAHAKGIKLRYWDQPGWPISTRNAIWKTLVGEGVDLINVDDLEGAAGEW
ncbi:Altered inheritance of mitochondria 6 protein [Rutstroemia sp. NJR-2017a BBW]|nr:Altered inheritance of mitochondria 6 protein [Rutstroemia sp. NJR-2017a BBW]